MSDSEGLRSKAGTSGAGKSGAAGGAVRLRLAGLAIVWENLWPALWPAFALAGLFVVLALCDLFRLLPGWLHAILLAGFAGGIVVALGRAAWRLRPPGIAASRRRLERASGLAHRPLTALADRLARVGSDPSAPALWQAHLARMAAATRRLRVGRPASQAAAIDPLAMRAVLT